MNSFNERGLGMQFDQYNSAMRKNCWICEKWVPVEFKVKDLEEPVFIHLEWMDYKPFYMTSDGGDEFVINTMNPPGEWKFFYTHKLE